MSAATYTYDPDQTLVKDQIRFFIGDTAAGGWFPGRWLLADQEIAAVISRYQTNQWEATAQCCLAAGRQAMVAYEQVDQGHRLRIKYNSADKLFNVFEAMAAEARTNTQPLAGQPTNPGAIAGEMCSPPYNPEGPGVRSLSRWFEDTYNV